MKIGCFDTKTFCQMSYCLKKTLAEVRVPALLGYRKNAKSRIFKIDKQYFNQYEISRTDFVKNKNILFKGNMKNSKKKQHNFWSKMAFFSKKKMVSTSAYKVYGEVLSKLRSRGFRATS